VLNSIHGRKIGTKHTRAHGAIKKYIHTQTTHTHTAHIILSMARTQNKLQQVEEILGEGVGRRSFQVSRAPSALTGSLLVNSFAAETLAPLL
jgi:hypothetical protein